MPDKEDIRQQLELLRKEFASSLVGRVNQLINDLGSLTDKLNPDVSLQEIFRNLHSLSGSAGTFGFNRLSEQARQLELIVKEFSQTHTLPDKKITGQLGSGLKLLLQQVKKGPDDVRLDSPTTNRDNNERFLYVVEDDPVQGQQLCLQLQHYGFNTQLLSSATETLNAIKQKLPDALIMDIILPEGQLAGTQVTSIIHQEIEETVPTIFISSRTDWESRLAAVRAGGMSIYTNL